MTPTLPLALRNALESGQCVLFLGAGLGACASDADGKRGPLGGELAAEICSHFSVPGPQIPLLGTAAQYVESVDGRKALVAYLRTRLGTLEPNETVLWIPSVRWRAVFTTNYDSVIERAYERVPEPSQRAVPVCSASDLHGIDPRFDVPIVHLHGWLAGSESDPLLLTDDDYATFRRHRSMLFDYLKVEFGTSPILYIGYSNLDANWRVVFNEVTAEFSPKTPPPSYRVAPSTTDVDKLIFAKKGITTIEGDLEDFVSFARVELDVHPVTARIIEAGRSSVPNDLADAYDRSPAAVLRLMNHWEYLNEVDLTGTPNAAAFYKGDAATWSLVSRGGAFERDVEVPVYDRLLDFVTAPGRRRDAVLVLGHAGSGISTLLMQLAMRMVRERVGPVFVLRPGAELIVGDVEFAATVFDEKAVFVIDRGAAQARQLEEVSDRLRDAHLAGGLLIGERTDKWRVRRPKIRVAEFGLGDLSSSEVDRLLDALEQNGGLGRLYGLTRAMQRTTIRNAHRGVLLVTMREATEGEQFDVIIENEYRSLEDEYCRALYLVVSSAHQVRGLLRDQVLAAILERDAAAVWNGVADATEGVIIQECADGARGVYASRTRHPIIAQIVWDRCATSGERERVLVRLVGALNLAYHIDRNLFEELIRSDERVDSLDTIEARMRFFEQACRSAPQDPYVLQHYARMLLRAGKLTAALAQADEAIRVGPRRHVLQHTRATVLRQMMVSAPTPELARKYLGSSEEAFRRALRLRDRDAYNHQGLASLYLQWAERAPSDEESAAYISKAEGVVSTALKTLRDRSDLWVVSSRIQEFIGNRPGAREHLEAAIEENPRNDVARYMLARFYLSSGDPSRAQNVIKPVLSEEPDDYRAAILCAEAMIECGEPMSSVAPILRLGWRRGQRDARYLAMFGGALFINGDFDAAAKVFEEHARRNFRYADLTQPFFRPGRRGDDGREELSGRVVTSGRGFAFISSPGYPDVFSRRHSVDGVELRRGMRVTFRLAFNAMGAVAENVGVSA